ncbi:MAG: hypothetical protein IPJ41_02520 [Phycisphaerales bacterium]|nr:hypothetical protein [Phycisphaerales bacterium]
MRERLWAVAARRATAAAYRGSPQGRAARPLAPAQPLLQEQLAVTLADRLPGPLTATLGVRGLRVGAWLLALPLRLAGRAAGVLLRMPREPGQ